MPGLRRTLTPLRAGALAWLLLVVFAAAAAPVLAPWTPDRQDLKTVTAAPGAPGHLLGTDDLGRDIWSRIIYGSRAALVVGSITVVIAGIFGTALGLAAGVGGRIQDGTIMLLLDGLLSIPTVLLAIAVVAFLGTGLVQVMVALGVVFAPVFARLARAETLALKSESFVEASRALGSSRWKTTFLHILPNITGPLVTQAALTFALALVVESSLSYLGLGAQPPEASWGLMLKEGRSYLVQAPWLSVAPGVAIAGTVLGCNILGDWLADGLNPTRPRHP